MILLDADVLLIDVRYTSDQRFATNRKALEEIHNRQLAVGITAHALLEVVGILSFNVSAGNIPKLPQQLCLQYGLSVCPDLQAHPAYAGCTVQDLVTQMSKQMALGDAVLAVQVGQHGPWANCLLTWNAAHFVGKLVVPVLTPQEWLNQLAASSP
ncbi:MAG TPA: hypothetical protein VKS79_21675 [Gemmataceae bacterium]|nr:hypothetical protein [Gemmataceae bacterium]